MKDDISTPTPEGSSPNEFERDKPQTNARGAAEAAIEDLRQRGGIFVDAVRATRMPMAMTDPTLPGNPIVFANKAFLRLTGYPMEEVLGQQPHFMNGPDTDPKDAARFTEAIRADQDDIIETVQYRKNGSRFIATVLISGFKDDDGRTVNHFMSWLDVTRRVDAEDEVADLKEVQAAMRVSEARLADELKSAQALQDLSSQLITDASGDHFFERIVDVAMTIMHADFGSMQMLDENGNVLRLIAWRNFHPEAAQYWQTVSVSTGTCCGSALQHGERVIIADVAEDDHLRGTESLRCYELSEIKAVQSTPLTTRYGRVIGMISTHWRETHEPAERELRLLDILARQAADFIERRRAEDAVRQSEGHANMLLAELQHRVRNTLAVVRSIARRTAENSRSAEDLLAHFQGRLDAFSRVQAALTRNADARMDLKSLIEDELVVHAARDGEQVEIKGPPVLLDGKSAERLSLAIHELATNAVKHGALTNGRGRIDVSWDTEETEGGEQQLNMLWIEREVAIEPNNGKREGFGMELLLRSLPYDLQCETQVELKPTGLRFELRMPLAAATG